MNLLSEIIKENVSPQILAEVLASVAAGEEAFCITAIVNLSELRVNIALNHKQAPDMWSAVIPQEVADDYTFANYQADFYPLLSECAHEYDEAELRACLLEEFQDVVKFEELEFEILEKWQKKAAQQPTA